MNVKNDNKALAKELAEALKFQDDEERFEIKASFIQLDILDEVEKFMYENNISRSELADKLKKSKSFISQLFSGDKALNLKMVAQLQEILNAKFVPSFKSYNELVSANQYNLDDYSEADNDFEKTPPIYHLPVYQNNLPTIPEYKSCTG